MTDWIERLSGRHRLILIYWLLNMTLFVGLLIFAVR